MREVLTRYGRHNIGVLWLVIEPMMFTLGVALWTPTLNHGSDIPIVAFASPDTRRSSVAEHAGALLDGDRANQALLYHRNVRPIDVC